MQDTTDNCQKSEPAREPLRLDLNFTFPLNYVTKLIVLGARRSSVAVEKFGVVGKKIWNGWCFFPALNQPYPATQVSVSWFTLPSDYVPTLDKVTFAILNTQPSHMQGEHWIPFANFCQKMFSRRLSGSTPFPQAAVRKDDARTTSILSQSLRFYAVYAAFYLFNFRQEESTGVHDVNVLSFISNYM